MIIEYYLQYLQEATKTYRTITFPRVEWDDIKKYCRPGKIEDIRFIKVNEE